MSNSVQHILPISPVALESRSSLLLGCCSCQLYKSCADPNMMYSRAERVFILHFTSHRRHSLLFVKHCAMCILTTNAEYNKSTPMLKTFRDPGSVWQVFIERQNGWNYCCTDFKQCISCKHQDTAARNQYFCFVRHYMREGTWCGSYDYLLNWTRCIRECRRWITKYLSDLFSPPQELWNPRKYPWSLLFVLCHLWSHSGTQLSPSN